MNTPTRWTIYCHIHIDSGRRYIGLTKKTMMFRWNQHLYNIKSKQGKGCHHFWNAIRKYGKDAFSHEILEVCYDLEVANLAEECWIEFYDTRNPEKGFNLIKGGTYQPHPIRKNPWNNPEYRAKSCIASKRKWQDPAFRSKVFSASIATTQSNEFRIAASERTKEFWQDPNYREKSIEALQERAADPILREQSRQRWNDHEYRKKCSVGIRAANAAQANAIYCKRGHLLPPPGVGIGWARECKTCYNIRKKAARICCPNGHLYDENTIISSDERRICKTCLDMIRGPRLCEKCGQPKTRKSGGNRFRCGPCTDERIAIWKASHAS
jgi:hypothetical protein